MIVCPNCATENADDARFCNQCGTPFAEATPGTAERRFLTVLFADLVGFTSESDEADPEDVRARLTPYHQRVRDEIERYGGTIEKLIGDGVMAVFGVPTAHEDDPERAVRAALRVQEAVDDADESHSGVALSVRIGVNSGEAIVTHSDDTERIVGDVVNTASRLESVAPPGGVIVGESTHRATKSLISYEELPPVEVKGKAKPLRIWRAIEPIGRFGVDAAVRPDTPFVGRDTELRVLTETFHRVLAERAIQLVTVTGAAGVGKTRLINEFSSWVDEQPDIVWWRQGRCLPYGKGISFWALGEIIKGQSGIRESDSPEVASQRLAQALEAIIEDPQDREWLAAQLAPLVGAEVAGGEATDRSESFTAWRRFLEELAAAGPLVMVIEDLHWADGSFMEFLEDLLVWSTDVPIMIISTARQELYENHPGWGGGHRNSTTISLGPLSDDQITRLLSALLEQAALPAETQQVLLERAGGTPLYAEEFVRMLNDRGAFEEKAGIAALGEGTIPVPETVQALIGARLDALSETDRLVLQDASVIGKVFWQGALESISEDDRDIAASLRQLVAREWIRPIRASSVEDQHEYAFRHILTRDVAYSRILRSARARKHQAVAQWIENSAGERATDHADLLAHHYLNALEVAEAAGDIVLIDDLRAEAARTLILAGDRNARLDTARAYEFYEGALDLMAPGDTGRPAVLLKASEAGLQGGLGTAIELCEQAVAAFREQGDRLQTGNALEQLSFAQAFSGGVEAGAEALSESIQLLEAEAPSPYLARAYTMMARKHMLLGNLEDQLAWSEKALAVTEQLELDEIRSRALGIRGIAEFQHGELDQGMADLEAALEIAERTGARSEILHSAYANLGDHVWLAKSAGEALEIFQRGIETLHRRGASAGWVTAESMRALFDLGRWDELGEVSTGLINTTEGSQLPTWARIVQALVHIWRGRVRKASALRDVFLPAAHGIGDLQVLAPALITAGLIQLAEGDRAGAIENVKEFKSVTEVGLGSYRASQLSQAVRILIATGQMQEAETLIEATAAPGARNRNSILAARAAATEARESYQDATELYAQAAAAWADYGQVLETALAHYGAGRCLLALDRATEAHEPLRQARRILVELGATPTVAEIDALLDEAKAI